MSKKDFELVVGNLQEITIVAGVGQKFVKQASFFEHGEAGGGVQVKSAALGAVAGGGLAFVDAEGGRGDAAGQEEEAGEGAACGAGADYGDFEGGFGVCYWHG